MFGPKKSNNSKAIGVYSSDEGTAIAAVDGATNERPRVSACCLFPPGEGFSGFVNKHKLMKSKCVDVLPTNSYSLLQVDLKGIKAEEKRETVRWQIRELLNFPAEQAVIDFLEVPVLGGEGKTRTYAVAAAADDLKLRIKQLKDAELSLDAIDIPEFALRNLLALYQGEPRGLCLLWIREQSSLLLICRGENMFFSRSINLGTQQLQAQKSSSTDDFLPEALQALLDGIVLEIQRSLDYCESNFRLPPVPKILVAIDGSTTEEILAYLDRFLHADVLLADFRQILDFPSEIESSMINACLPALGAALRAGGRV